ncbi:hypothetical protein SERLA73DRAFT_187884 [Serpula lacrymans var. lacrymans S7.3]|uniref:Phosphoglycerate mutase-like protein n=2 Tax=Serpula lacrymans var. lacrymans TaxID=341189 RepID=F8QAM7_SERL3|nr:uncharacterized protein SERLADRAFT_477767 [Serpula lacrymans var. lacrymans S7.9]EGN94817.1 hypothetical protein SERLA73DRAFT_187884 [Serpula lacrymans var. lacrymans S7.3]EGO20316.1 hypothetical protein SERLADRAFT_477767 [Serpula lacrymans var. lacrymans S7.9]
MSSIFTPFLRAFSGYINMQTSQYITSPPSFDIPHNHGIYNSSTTPAHLPWNTYNYCNAPHVNPEYYSKPSHVDSGITLVFLNGMMRHHKRTPDNLYPNERDLDASVTWECKHLAAHSYIGGTARIFHETIIPDWHPFAVEIWNGTCDSGQLTREGLEDAIKHGKDFWSVYHDKNVFLQNVVEDDIYIRTSTEARTQHVAGGFLFGMDPSTAAKSWPVYMQPRNIDALVPGYSCPTADAIRSAYQSVPAWLDHLTQHVDLQARLEATLGTGHLNAWSSWYDHYFDTFTSRTCHRHPLPCNSSGNCVSQDDASRVYFLGDWEYNYIWNTAENATFYNQLTFGVMFMELAQNLRRFRSGEDRYKLRLYVGHDGSMIRLASGLGLGQKAPLRWPAMGSEILTEVWRTSTNQDFVRVLHDGTPVKHLEWVSLQDFIDLLEAQVPENIFDTCNLAVT